MRFELPEKLSSLLFVILLALVLPWYGNLTLVVFILMARRIIRSLNPVSTVSATRFRKALIYFASAALVMIPINGLLLREGEPLQLLSTLTFFSSGLEFGLRT